MKEYHDPEVLTELYRERKMTQKEIGDKFGVSHRTISNWINKHGIEKGKTEHQKSEVLIELYHEEEMSLSDIGDKFDVSKNTIEYWMKKHDIETRKAHNKRPPCYRETRGYRAWIHHDGEKQQSVRVHRLLAVSEFGFEAVRDMDVHHKNEIKCDNKPDNIELMSRSEHAKLHRKKEEDGEVSILEQIEAEFDEFEKEYMEESE